MLWIPDCKKAESKSHVCGVAIERMRDRIRLKVLEAAEAWLRTLGRKLVWR